MAGTVNFEVLKDLIEQKRQTGISLTTLRFGTDNYNDQLMEQLADAGNGNYGYIDNLKKAQKVLVDEISFTTHTIAKDVKIQIEFNPDVVAEYRVCLVVYSIVHYSYLLIHVPRLCAN